jgi:hypothetical protein
MTMPWISILFALFLGFAQSQSRAADALVIIHSATAVTVLVNETGYRKLAPIFDDFGGGNHIQWVSPAGDMSLACTHLLTPQPELDSFSCQFRMIASPNVVVESTAYTASAQVPVPVAKVQMKQFTNNNRETFNLMITPDGVRLSGAMLPP